MPLRQVLPASGAEAPIHEIQNEEGVIVLGYNGVGTVTIEFRSEERRVGKECRSRWSPYH